jgi:hypothetical protein
VALLKKSLKSINVLEYLQMWIDSNPFPVATATHAEGMLRSAVLERSKIAPFQPELAWGEQQVNHQPDHLARREVVFARTATILAHPLFLIR